MNVDSLQNTASPPDSSPRRSTPTSLGASRSLAGASVIVAGGSGGIGRPLVEHLLRRDARLTLVARRPERLPVDPAVTSVAGDLADPQVCEHAVELAAREGRIDGVINVAGVVAFGPLAELDDDTLSELFNTNVFGPLRLVRTALPYLDGGFVANVTGIVALQPMANMVAYSASKAALSSATEALRRELRPRRVDVIDICPPHTETGLAGRPIAGSAPRLAAGADPDAVARRILDAVVGRERNVPPTEFDSASAG